MDKDTTRNLSRILENTSEQKDADGFVQSAQFQYFYQYFNSFMADSSKSVTDVIRSSGISRNYVYNIINGDKKHPGRDKVLALCIGAGMNYTQTQRALEISGLAALYPKDERDVRIAIAINQGMENVMEVNDLLYGFGLELIKI